MITARGGSSPTSETGLIALPSLHCGVRNACDLNLFLLDWMLYILNKWPEHASCALEWATLN